MQEDDDKLQELIEIEEISIKLEEMLKIVKKIRRNINEGTKTIVDKKVVAEKEINKNPLIFLATTFIGGLFIGYLIRKKNKC